MDLTKPGEDSETYFRSRYRHIIGVTVQLFKLQGVVWSELSRDYVMLHMYFDMHDMQTKLTAVDGIKFSSFFLDLLRIALDYAIVRHPFLQFFVCLIFTPINFLIFSEHCTEPLQFNIHLPAELFRKLELIVVKIGDNDDELGIGDDDELQYVITPDLQLKRPTKKFVHFVRTADPRFEMCGFGFHSVSDLTDLIAIHSHPPKRAQDFRKKFDHFLVARNQPTLQQLLAPEKRPVPLFSLEDSPWREPVPGTMSSDDDGDGDEEVNAVVSCLADSFITVPPTLKHVSPEYKPVIQCHFSGSLRE
ncbi:unnamed protein product [Gongylonema pulchrum]|uniref:DUF4708 domain-containing protein n=1 Tax=Gongylonema pulchrum TaxID=637853 RepID=A0A183E7E1_9BILA|nr:unnamed protein product [Gongylonema pulchrum]